MAPNNKRRKVTFDAAPNFAVVVPARNTIASFGRVSKGAVTSQASSKFVTGSEIIKPEINVLQEVVSNGTEQRKAKSTKRKPENDLRTPAKTIKTETGKFQAVLPGDENAIPAIAEIRSATPPPSLPRQTTKHFVNNEPDTPTKKTLEILAGVTLSPSPTKGQSKATTLFPTSSSPAAPTPCPRKRRREDDLPDELQELVDLHTSLLSVLGLHYAHNGTATPVDLKSIAPGIGKSWGRRNPTTEDIRRVFAIQQRSADGPDQAALLSVWDYGKQKTCIEYCEPSAKVWGRARQPLETQKLSRAFINYLREAYTLSQQNGQSAAELVEELPLARLHKRATSKANKSMIMSKGQTRLTELKAGAIQAQKRNEPKRSIEPAITATESSVKSRLAFTTPTRPAQCGQSLLERIRAKESLLASQPSGPTQAQLERRSALHRVPEIINVLSLLCGNAASSPSRGLAPSPMAITAARTSDDELAELLGMASPKSTPSPQNGRGGMQAMFGGAFVKNVSMSLQQVIERVQSSSRSPVAASEVERVVRLLANEVCPDWITLRELGSVKSVTIRGGSPADGWMETLERLIASS